MSRVSSEEITTTSMLSLNLALGCALVALVGLKLKSRYVSGHGWC